LQQDLFENLIVVLKRSHLQSFDEYIRQVVRVQLRRLDMFALHNSAKQGESEEKERRMIRGERVW
jgi:hypothetical protein